MDSRRFTYSVLIGIILLTLPCYCLGIIAYTVAPEASVDLPEPIVTPTLLSTVQGVPATFTIIPTFPVFLTDTPRAATPTLPATPTQFQTATTTPAVTPSVTPSQTATGTPTLTTSPTATTTGTATATATESATDTPIPTDTPAPTDTPPPTDTPLPTNTPTDTPTPSATPTSTPIIIVLTPTPTTPP